jgi:hypothetical protein
LLVSFLFTSFRSLFFSSSFFLSFVPLRILFLRFLPSFLLVLCLIPYCIVQFCPVLRNAYVSTTPAIIIDSSRKTPKPQRLATPLSEGDDARLRISHCFSDLSLPRVPRIDTASSDLHQQETTFPSARLGVSWMVSTLV